MDFRKACVLNEKCSKGSYVLMGIKIYKKTYRT